VSVFSRSFAQKKRSIGFCCHAAGASLTAGGVTAVSGRNDHHDRSVFARGRITRSSGQTAPVSIQRRRIATWPAVNDLPSFGIRGRFPGCGDVISFSNRFLPLCKRRCSPLRTNLFCGHRNIATGVVRMMATDTVLFKYRSHIALKINRHRFCRRTVSRDHRDSK